MVCQFVIKIRSISPRIATVAAAAMTVRILLVLSFKSFLRRRRSNTPRMPPVVLVITSVISVAPMPRIYCISSNSKLTSKPVKHQAPTGQRGWSRPVYSPSGIKARIFIQISPRSSFPLTIKEAPNGIRLMERNCPNAGKETLPFNRISQVKTIR